ncbi:MAG: phosphate transport system substrate-binding protein, partial [Psychromonas sp.]|uniref:PstS family phosphate ABC transporter substrate-binding protein n=1 Tax=Psychromonas sp. TaxID=1884585 RepID=UPI0039E5AD98
MSEQNANLSLNPLFKKQLSLLQAIAKSEFNIHISLDKMAQDKQYRETVLNELSELDNETLNKQIHLLRRVPVYIKPPTEKPTIDSFMLDSLPSPQRPSEKTRNRVTTEKIEIKRSRFSLIAFSALFFISLTVFWAWQNGYLYISLTPDAPLAAPLLIEEKPEPVIEDSPITIAAVTAALKSDPLIIPLALPSTDRIISLRLHGSNTVGESLAPALLEAYLKSQGITEMLWVQGTEQVERELQYIKDDHIYAIELHAHGSSTGFKDILNSKADMAMSSRKIKDKEVQLLRPLYGDLGLSGQEYIIGLDGVAVIVNPKNPIAHLSSEILAKIFSGEIGNWAELGGPDLQINVYARDRNSGTWDTFKSVVLEANGKQLISNARRYESSSELSEEVAKDTAAIGFIGLPYVNNSKAIAIAASDSTMPIYPTRFTISTEDYPLARRLYVYAPSVGNKMVKELANFITSRAGQDIVEQIGL